MYYCNIVSCKHSDNIVVWPEGILGDVLSSPVLPDDQDVVLPVASRARLTVRDGDHGLLGFYII